MMMLAQNFRLHQHEVRLRLEISKKLHGVLRADLITSGGRAGEEITDQSHGLRVAVSDG